MQTLSSSPSYYYYYYYYHHSINKQHAKRLYPLQFLPKDVVEWAYAESDSDGESVDVDVDVDATYKWVAVDKSITSGAPAGIEKKIGFEGNPDSSGFYSRDNGGVLAGFGGDQSAERPSQNKSPDRSVLPRVK